jgi:atypical dual specificity phosphatase
MLSLKNGSSQWAQLQPAYISGQAVTLPADQIHYSKRVPDELRFVYRGGRLLPVTSPRLVRPGCVAVAAESPHLHEYTPAFEPIGPLQNPRTKTRIKNYLPGLLQQALVPDDVDVVLVNPIQYQTSLVRLWQPGCQSQMLGQVRNTIWKGLWAASAGNARVFEQDFLTRMSTYQPFLTINACTAELKPLVDVALKANGFQVVGVTQHPSYWNSKSALLGAAPDVPSHQQVYATSGLPAFEFDRIEDWLLAGRNPLTAIDVEQMLAQGVTHVLDLREEQEWRHPRFGAEAVAALQARGVERLHLPVVDTLGPSPEQFEAACAFLAAAERQPGARVYVHCRGGWERTAAVLTAYVARRDALPWRDALCLLQGQRDKFRLWPAQETAVRAWTR